MIVTEVNYTDLPGRVFDGYDLHLELNRRGIKSFQIVRDKKSATETVKSVSIENMPYAMINEFEKMYGIENMLMPTAAQIETLPEYLDADIVHFHILHNDMISLIDYPRLMNNKKSVWTIHDPWITTGGCIHALDCRGREEGCRNCKVYNNSGFMYEQKKKYISEVNPVVVVSTKWMKEQLENSPITSHFNNIEIIPFGVRVDDYKIENKEDYRSKYGIKSDECVVIGFRLDDSELKGCKYIFEALRKIDNKNIVLMTVGTGSFPDDIKQKYRIIELGWQDDKEVMMKFFVSCDIFVMPSLAESFGLMAIEAMAAECVVICFAGTAVETNINASGVGVSVMYKSAEGIATAITNLLSDKKEIVERGKLGRKRVKDYFSFDKYIEKHIDLYEEMSIIVN